jgi:cell shape-determining protein MreC
MENPTLINGFEDIIKFIRNQDIRIKNLEQQNKELNNILEEFAECQKENKELKDSILTCKLSISIRDTEIDELKEKIENTLLP